MARVLLLGGVIDPQRSYVSSTWPLASAWLNAMRQRLAGVPTWLKVS